MTPEEYIKVLKSAQETLVNVKEDLDRAIQRMEKRLETGYEYNESKSRLALGAAHETVKCVLQPQLWELLISDIDYDE